MKELNDFLEERFSDEEIEEIEDGAMKKVIIESPYAGNVKRNTQYAREALHDCLMRGEAPFASHLLYTQPDVLDDGIPDERDLGIRAGLAWGEEADETAVFVDFGISKGMKRGIERAVESGRRVTFRSIRDMQSQEIIKTAEEEGITGVKEGWREPAGRWPYILEVSS